MLTTVMVPDVFKTLNVEIKIKLKDNCKKTQA